ncbi:MAG: NupC/NupG family nucleoside CNT transporter [Myxococcota bacterium]|nr:NupC/NupG family nucleoside CNT transporter [Myxococcota bacterium]MDW8361151.1 nucleoside transporter C-terminal domain-containing protein [Myxococcales bacterium]
MSLPASAVERLASLLGVGLLALLAWALSTDRRRVPWRILLWGLGLQLGFGLLVLWTPMGVAVFGWVNDAVVRVLDFTREGSRFLFGAYLDERFTVALGVLPTIVFFSSFMSVLYHLGLMQRVVRAMAWLMQRTMGTSGAETLSAAANVFVGQTEAPLVVRPFVARMTRSELHAVMVGGFATVAGGVLAAYVGMLRDLVPGIAGHLVSASVLSAPAALVVAKLMVPETERPETAGALADLPARTTVNVIDAAARGAADGLLLALNVAAMLLAFLALVALCNALLAWPVQAYNAWAGASVPVPTLQGLFGVLFWPLAIAMGVPPAEAGTVGMLLGEKTVLNEFVAYTHLAEGLRDGTLVLSERSRVIASYALCGFANFGSIAIQIGGIGSIAPERRADLARLGLRAMVGGLIAACMTGAVAGALA